MITKSNFKNLSVSLGFTETDGIYEKKYLNCGVTMRVDFSAGKLYYPDTIKGRERNDSFDAAEKLYASNLSDENVELGPVANDTIYRTFVAYEEGILTREETIARLKVKNIKLPGG